MFFLPDRKMQTFSIFETKRLLFYVVFLSTFLLFFSCFTLLKSRSSDSLIPDSVLKLMNPNGNPTIPNTKISSHSSQGVSRGNDNSYCDSNRAKLKIYMYDLPPEFHFGLLGWKPKKSSQIWPEVRELSQIPRYPGGLNIQHSVEYWLTLDLLVSNGPEGVRPCSAVRVNDSSQADVIFLPFFSSISYNRHNKVIGQEKVSRDRFLQGELVKFLMSRKEWKRRGGKDHLVLAHHPNSMLEARRKLGSVMFLLADFGRYPVEIANLKKDVIAPYVHVVPSIREDSLPFDKRPILAYFQGAINRKDGGMIRQELYRLLKDEEGVHFTFGSARANGVKIAGKGMSSSKFCLNIAGDTPSSNRLFDAIVSHCVPVTISDDIELPFEDALDYSEFSIFVHSSDAIKEGFLINLLRGINQHDWTKKWERLKQVSHHFEYEYPSRQGDAVQMIWEAVARKILPVAHKLSSLRLKTNKEKRFLSA